MRLLRRPLLLTVVCGMLIRATAFAAPASAPAPAAESELPPRLRQAISEMVEPWKQEKAAPAVVVVARLNGVTGVLPFGEAGPGRLQPATVQIGGPFSLHLTHFSAACWDCPVRRPVIY